MPGQQTTQHPARRLEGGQAACTLLAGPREAPEACVCGHASSAASCPLPARPTPHLQVAAPRHHIQHRAAHDGRLERQQAARRYLREAGQAGEGGAW